MPYENVLVELAKRIRSEPFLFVIAVAAIFIGLAVAASGLGTSEFRLIVVIIAVLAGISIVGYYFLEVKKGRLTRLDPDDLQESETSTLAELPIPPVFEESRQFARLNLFKQKKDLVIHPMENRIATGAVQLSDHQLVSCALSPWDFDRIALYLYEERSAKPSFGDRMHHVDQEFEKIKASDNRRSLIPLHYAVRSILEFLKNRRQISQEAKASLDDFDTIFAYLKAQPELDQGNQVKDNLQKIIKLLRGR